MPRISSPVRATKGPTNNNFCGNEFAFPFQGYSTRHSSTDLLLPAGMTSRKLREFIRRLYLQRWWDLKVHPSEDDHSSGEAAKKKQGLMCFGNPSRGCDGLLVFRCLLTIKKQLVFLPSHRRGSEVEWSGNNYDPWQIWRHDEIGRRQKKKRATDNDHD